MRMSLVHRTDTFRHGGQSLPICPPGARTEGIKQQTDEVLPQACPSRHNFSHKKRETGCRRQVPPATPSNTARRDGRFLVIFLPAAPHHTSQFTAISHATPNADHTSPHASASFRDKTASKIRPAPSASCCTHHRWL